MTMGVGMGCWDHSIHNITLKPSEVTNLMIDGCGMCETESKGQSRGSTPSPAPSRPTTSSNPGVTSSTPPPAVATPAAAAAAAQSGAPPAQQPLPPKQDKPTTRAERRAVQEAQKAAKAAKMVKLLSCNHCGTLHRLRLMHHCMTKQ